MEENILLYLRFGIFRIPVRAKRVIEHHMTRLYAQTGLPPIPVYLKTNDGKKRRTWLAAFCRENGKKYFEFNVDFMDGLTANELEQLCLHEFAHYAAIMQTGASQGHNSYYRELCKTIGCSTPDPAIRFDSFDVTHRRHLRSHTPAKVPTWTGSIVELKREADAGQDWAGFLYGKMLLTSAQGINQNLRMGLQYIAQGVEAHYEPSMALFSQVLSSYRGDFEATRQAIELELT